MLDLHKLQIFAQVAQAGSFSAAAARLLMSQPAVSQHIRELEDALGVRLFRRGRRGVALTAEGRTLLDYTQRIFALVAEAKSAVLNVANLAGGQLNIGATPGVSAYLLPDWIRDFQERYPQLVVTAQTATTPGIAAQLAARLLDLGFVEGDLDAADAARLDAEVLCEVPQYVLVGPKHAFWARESVALHELDGQAFVMRQPGSQSRLWLDHVLEAHGARPRVAAEFDNLEAIKRSVIGSAALAVLPAYAVRAELQAGSLRALHTDVLLTRALRAVWDKSSPLSPIARAFLTFADACVHDAHARRPHPSARRYARATTR
ncbi:MAG: LysR family transcriptional regulator [Thermoflexales bacterium]|nr:LysR family transcriptional regulator [Thermoflexales bacterium]MDW8351495.1 LysR family transcriptional regulator [Anaerolineae bacterium]